MKENILQKVVQTNNDDLLSKASSVKNISESIKIHSFCAKTSKGLIRNYNEDKVAIILDMKSNEDQQ